MHNQFSFLNLTVNSKKSARSTKCGGKFSSFQVSLEQFFFLLFRMFIFLGINNIHVYSDGSLHVTLTEKITGVTTAATIGTSVAA
jgi:hypothetical protein